MADARASQKVVPTSPTQDSQGLALGEVNEPKGELPGIFSWQQGQAVTSASPAYVLPALGTAGSLILFLFIYANT